MQTPVPTLALPNINVLPGPGAPAILNWFYAFIFGVMCLIVLAAAFGTFLGAFFKRVLRL